MINSIFSFCKILIYIDYTLYIYCMNIGGNELEKLVIHGGTKLKGEVNISGAKNAAVAIIPATLLLNGVYTINNVPNISDVKITCDILQDLGAKSHGKHQMK